MRSISIRSIACTMHNQREKKYELTYLFLNNVKRMKPTKDPNYCGTEDENEDEGNEFYWV